jgi:hypothetical protein
VVNRGCVVTQEKIMLSQPLEKHRELKRLQSEVNYWCKNAPADSHEARRIRVGKQVVENIPNKVKGVRLLKDALDLSLWDAAGLWNLAKFLNDQH